MAWRSRSVALCWLRLWSWVAMVVQCRGGHGGRGAAVAAAGVGGGGGGGAAAVGAAGIDGDGTAPCDLVELDEAVSRRDSGRGMRSGRFSALDCADGRSFAVCGWEGGAELDEDAGGVTALRCTNGSVIFARVGRESQESALASAQYVRPRVRPMERQLLGGVGLMKTAQRCLSTRGRT